MAGTAVFRLDGVRISPLKRSRQLPNCFLGRNSSKNVFSSFPRSRSDRGSGQFRVCCRAAGAQSKATSDDVQVSIDGFILFLFFNNFFVYLIFLRFPLVLDKTV